MIRKDQADLIYKTEDAKFDAVVDDLVERYEAGQPVLVGTISVEKSEKLSRLLEKQGIRHEVLNAKAASTSGRARSSPRPAGCRPSPWPPTWPAAASTSSSAATPRDWPSATCGPRASIPTTTRTGPAPGAGGQARARDQGRGRPGPRAGRPLRARHRAPRLPPHRQPAPGPVRPAGRPGREPLLPVSLDDDLMRLFATGAVNWVMSKTLPDDVPIEAKMVTKAIERAQTTVEQRNAEIRKNVLKYDEVMNEQRKVIYARRDQILDHADLRERIVGEALRRRGRARWSRPTASASTTRSGTSRAWRPRPGPSGRRPCRASRSTWRPRPTRSTRCSWTRRWPTTRSASPSSAPRSCARSSCR